MSRRPGLAETASAALTRRSLLRGALAAAAAPYAITSFSLAGEGRPLPSNRLTVGAIGMGGRGSGDMRGFLSHEECQVVSVCDVVQSKREAARSTVDNYYGASGCTAVNDFRDITSRPDVDAVMIGTPDHWHAIISVEAMKSGKDVFCEKPETLTVREGRTMVEVARRHARVFSGGSQRVWEDYNWFHKMVRAGAIGDVQECWVNVGGPSAECSLPEMPVPPGLDWDLWLGPAPGAPFNPGRLNFRAWRDYSGGGMTDWGAHGFGGALFCMGLHQTGPVEIIPPDGKDNKGVTYVFANGIRMYHGGGWGGIMSYRGTKGEIPDRGAAGRSIKSLPAPDIGIPNYKGRGGLIGDFLHCVRTRERPWRDIEVAHRTVTVCHLGNIAYWLGRAVKWDPVREEIVGDAEAARWLDRPKRAPWRL
ncbi:MAG: Gfo/Idh/MocA family oxidoreductase [Planctomycetes bacterium]|nr:Gfo/Idh/MocA family oxidoreductase [Planctomycetota bacterium]